MIKYRPEIDGLRAVAVLPVVFYHAGVFGFAGGFAGVDVFFVISGYLITSILMKDIYQKKFSYRDFYERRVRRILPVFLFVSLTTIPFAYFLMSPMEAVSYARNLISSALYFSNFDLAFQAGYFDNAAIDKPLLHTWSLSVEEQYYLFFPLLIVLSLRKSYRLFVAIVLTLILLSFIFAQLGSDFSPHKNFFFTFGRAWELLTGAIVASLYWNNKIRTMLERVDVKIKDIFCVAGLSGLLFTFLFYDKTVVFPSAYTLLPVMSTVLIILFARSDGFFGKFLSSKYLVFVGLISYSLYLWHQPILSFLSLSQLDGFGFSERLFAVIISFPIAYISWKLIESPFRKKGYLQTKTLVLGFVVLTTFQISIGVIVVINDGFPGKSSNQEKWSIFDRSRYELTGYQGARCHEGDVSNPCQLGHQQSDIVVALVGDSFAGQYTDAFSNYLNEKYYRGVQFTFGGCPFGDSLESINPGASCVKKRTEVLKTIEQLDVDYVIVSSWWQGYDGGHGLCNPTLDGNCNSMTKDELYDSYVEGLNHLASRVKHVYLIAAQPTTPLDLERHFALGKESRLSGLLRSKFIESVSGIHSKFQNGLLSNVNLIYPHEYLCPDGWLECLIKDSGSYLYMDNHLSNYGANVLFQYWSNSGELP